MKGKQPPSHVYLKLMYGIRVEFVNVSRNSTYLNYSISDDP